MEKRITGRTGMFCLIGTPVGHSGSPAMYNYSFAQDVYKRHYNIHQKVKQDKIAQAKAERKAKFL